MSSGHASHKGGHIKHSSDTGQIDAASKLPGDPQELLGEGEGYPFDAQGTEVNPAATERPSDNSAEQQQQES